MVEFLGACLAPATVLCLAAYIFTAVECWVLQHANSLPASFYTTHTPFYLGRLLWDTWEESPGVPAMGTGLTAYSALPAILYWVMGNSLGWGGGVPSLGHLSTCTAILLGYYHCSATSACLLLSGILILPPASACSAMPAVDGGLEEEEAFHHCLTCILLHLHSFTILEGGMPGGVPVLLQEVLPPAFTATAMITWRV